MAITGWLVRDEFALVLELWVLGLVAVNTVLDLPTERSNKTLYWPSSSITKSTNGVTLDLVGKLLKHVNFSKISVSEFHALEHIDHPSGSFTARSALAARLVLVEFGEAKNSINNIGLVVHNNDSSSAKTGASIFKIIEVHNSFFTLLFNQHWDR